RQLARAGVERQRARRRLLPVPRQRAYLGVSDVRFEFETNRRRADHWRRREISVDCLEQRQLGDRLQPRGRAGAAERGAVSLSDTAEVATPESVVPAETRRTSLTERTVSGALWTITTGIGGRAVGLVGTLVL